MAEIVGGDDDDDDDDNDDDDDGENVGMSFLSIPPKVYIFCNTTLARLYATPSYNKCVQNPLPPCVRSLKANTGLMMPPCVRFLLVARHATPPCDA